jgi:hypothetical protein
MYLIDTTEKVHFLRRNVAVTGQASARGNSLRKLAEHAGYSVFDASDVAENGTRQEAGPDVDLLIADLTSISERPSQEITNISRYLEISGVEALIWTDMENLEEAYAKLPISQCHFMVGGSDLEALLIMSGATKKGRRGKKMDQLHDRNRDSGFGDLHKISDELADFARTLARLAEKDDVSEPPALAERPVSFRPAPANIIQPFIEKEPAARVAPSTVVDAKYIREIIKLRRRREVFFDPELFADPAWDILLDLLAARLEGRSVSVSSLCIAAAVPATTALRWITGMTESGILVRRQDPTDARRIFIDLSEGDAAKLMDYFAELRKTNAVIV